MLNNCIKQVVTATIITPAGKRYVGSNYTTKDNGGICPRAEMKSGEGYDLCRDICGQIGHAEVIALMIAGDEARGSTLYIEGHTYACDSCKKAADIAGITSIIIGSPPC